MRVLRIHAAAADEAAEAAAWYEKERPGLGADFEHAIDAAGASLSVLSIIEIYRF